MHVGAVHAPALQTCPAAQALPQAPQLVALVPTSTHVPEQSICPAGHITAGRHAPIAQVCPIGQAIPQAPQLLLSVCVLTHVPEQSVWPPVHITTLRHAPIMHC